MIQRAFVAFLLTLSSCKSSSTTTSPSKSFSVEEIASYLPHCSKWEMRALTAQEEVGLDDALSQTYSYLGSGGQCYAFSSEDGRYILKFFKQKAFAIPQWLEQFPLPFFVRGLKNKKLKKRESKRNKVFSAFKLSFDLLPQETGILYVHLNPTGHFNRSLKVKGPSGLSYELDLNDFEFVIQKRAELAYHRIDSLVKAQNLEGAKRAIDQLLALHIQLYKKGIRNKDANFRSNYGFIGDEPIIVDVGRVVYCEKIKKLRNYKSELERIAPRFRNWIQLTHPQLLSHFDGSMEKIGQESEVTCK